MSFKNLMSRKEAAQYLGLASQTLAIWACTKRHALPYIRIGRLAKYRKSDLDAFINARFVGKEEPAHDIVTDASPIKHTERPPSAETRAGGRA